MNNKFIVNFIKNSFHRVDSFFSSDNETVVFTEDGKCFPIKEVEIVDENTVTDSLLNVLTTDVLMSLLVDPDTGEQLIL